MDELWIDDAGFVWSGNFRLPLRVDYERGVVEFFDKDKRRSYERGSRFVEIQATSMVEVLQSTARAKNGTQTFRD